MRTYISLSTETCTGTFQRTLFSIKQTFAEKFLNFHLRQIPQSYHAKIGLPMQVSTNQNCSPNEKAVNVRFFSDTGTAGESN